MSAVVPAGFYEVAPRVRRIDVPLGERFVSLYLIVGEQEVMLFDVGVTGMIEDVVLPAMRAIGVDPADVRHVVISHCDVDHFGGAADARRSFVNARIVAHGEDAAAIEDFGTYLVKRGDSFREFGWTEAPETLEWARSVTAEAPLDGLVDGGEEFDLGGLVVRVLHVPGHTEGHLALYVPSSGALLVSDAVLGRSVDLADGTPAFPPTYRFVADYLETISALQDLDAETLLTAHYPTLSGRAAAEFLQQSHDFAVQTEALTLRIVNDSPDLTFRELLSLANPVAGDWPDQATEGALAYPIAGHLERLEASGALVSTGEGDGRVWRVA